MLTNSVLDKTKAFAFRIQLFIITIGSKYYWNLLWRVRKEYGRYNCRENYRLVKTIALRARMKHIDRTKFIFINVALNK